MHNNERLGLEFGLSAECFGFPWVLVIDHHPTDPARRKKWASQMLFRCWFGTNLESYRKDGYVLVCHIFGEAFKR